MNFKRSLILCLGCVLSAVLLPQAFAQTYPSKPIKWIVPYAAGGGSDALARTVAAQMSTQMGQQVIIENRPGGAATIGASAVAKSPADGYTVLSADNGPLVFNTALFKELTYNPSKDFAPIGLMVRFPLLIVVNPATGYTSAKQLIEDMQKNPGKLSYGTAGIGSPHHIAMEMLKGRANFDATHISYKGAAPALQDVVGGQLPMMVVDTAAGMPMIKAGKVKVLATFSRTRLATMPDVPTLIELGYADTEAFAWQGLLAPAATPKDIIAKLSVELQKAIETPSVRTRLLDLGLEPTPSDAAAMGDLINKEMAYWPNLIRDRKISLD